MNHFNSPKKLGGKALKNRQNRLCQRHIEYIYLGRFFKTAVCTRKGPQRKSLKVAAVSSTEFPVDGI